MILSAPKDAVGFCVIKSTRKSPERGDLFSFERLYEAGGDVSRET
jgi:hypothetical protein